MQESLRQSSSRRHSFTRCFPSTGGTSGKGADADAPIKGAESATCATAVPNAVNATGKRQGGKKRSFRLTLYARFYNFATVYERTKLQIKER